MEASFRGQLVSGKGLVKRAAPPPQETTGFKEKVLVLFILESP